MAERIVRSVSSRAMTVTTKELKKETTKMERPSQASAFAAVAWRSKRVSSGSSAAAAALPSSAAATAPPL
jgi:hypothetical protein